MDSKVNTNVHTHRRHAITRTPGNVEIKSRDLCPIYTFALYCHLFWHEERQADNEFELSILSFRDHTGPRDKFITDLMVTEFATTEHCELQ